jgi:hypothetical protein
MMIKLIRDTIKEYLKQKKLYKQLLKSPFDYNYLYGLVQASQKDVIIQIQLPDTSIITIRRNGPGKVNTELDYYKC